MRGPEKMNILKRAAIWLLTKQEKKTMTDQALDLSAQQQPAADQAINTDPTPVAQVQPQNEQLSALETMKAAFAAKIQFIESGIATLGADAEKELVDLAEKYL